MTTWRAAPAIEALQRTLDLSRPGRRARYPDGVIGDADHSARKSDHNPDDDDMVCAVDVHDSDVLDDASLYRSLKEAGNLNPVKYAINDGKIWSPARGECDYDGPSPHTEHCHVSVTQAGKRRTGDWILPGIHPAVKSEEDDMTTDQARQLKEVHAMLTALVRPRRGDKKDHDSGAVDLGDVLSKIEDETK